MSEFNIWGHKKEIFKLVVRGCGMTLKNRHGLITNLTKDDYVAVTFDKAELS